MRDWVKWALTVLFIIGAVPLAVPQLLAFPYKAEIGGHILYAETPIPEAEAVAILDEAAARIATSPLAVEPETRRIFLTNGGWRWHWLAAGSSDAFAISRPILETIVVNRSDIRANHVTNGAEIGGVRSLSGVIAHEVAHGMIRRRFGVASDRLYPGWLIEGYADHVAGESSLDEADLAALAESGEDHPALRYYHGRRRVEAILRGNGESVDSLFEVAD